MMDSVPVIGRDFFDRVRKTLTLDVPPALHDLTLTDFPRGPLLRHLGEGDSLARNQRDRDGAEHYWHANLNLALPIPALSAPLIPNEEVAPGVTLKRLLKNKASDSVAFYADQLEQEGMSPAAALAQARATYGEVRPAIEYIADRANVYSLKPLLLFDVGGTETRGGAERVAAAAGGGMQLTIVTAKMEIGYMHSVLGPHSGNFFGRIVFVNLF